MPTKFSNDLDFVPPAPKLHRPKKPIPEPQPLPKFSPLKPPLRHGKPNLSPSVDRADPLHLFDLFLPEADIDETVTYTNRNAELNPSQEEDLKGHSKRWIPCTREEIYVYIGVTLTFGLHQEAERDAYWNTKESQDPLYPRIRAAISRDRFSILDRFFYLEEPLHKKLFPPPPPTPTPTRPTRKRKAEFLTHEDSVAFEYRNPFEKINWLSERLRHSCMQLWIPGTHLAVVESIVRFLGRASETVNIPSKPTPEGFKIWILANQGYVLDWL